jgi:hypothetical protein
MFSKTFTRLTPRSTPVSTVSDASTGRMPTVSVNWICDRFGISTDAASLLAKKMP